MYLKKFNELINIILEETKQNKEESFGKKLKKELLTKTESPHNNYGGSYGLGYRLGAALKNKLSSDKNKKKRDDYKVVPNYELDEKYVVKPKYYNDKYIFRPGQQNKDKNKDKEQTKVKTNPDNKPNQPPKIKFERISKDELQRAINQNKIQNENKWIKNFDQIKKFFGVSNMDYWVMKEGDQIRACACCYKNKFNSYCVNELQSYKKGFGEMLLNNILKFDYDVIYLFSNWQDPDEQKILDDFYSKSTFGLIRYDNKNKHYFYKNKALGSGQFERFKQQVLIG